MLSWCKLVFIINNCQTNVKKIGLKLMWFSSSVSFAGLYSRGWWRLIRCFNQIGKTTTYYRIRNGLSSWIPSWSWYCSFDIGKRTDFWICWYFELGEQAKTTADWSLDICHVSTSNRESQIVPSLLYCQGNNPDWFCKIYNLIEK